MKPEYKYIELIFENCNFIRIYPKDVNGFLVDKISSCLWSNLSHQFSETLSCGSLIIILDNRALNIETQFQKDHDSSYKSASLSRHLDIYKNITHVLVKVNRKKELYISVPYEGEEDRYDSPNILLSVQYGKDDFTININEK